MKRVPWDLVVASALYLVLRGLVLVSAFDQTAMPMYELFPMGTMAELAREGVSLPLSYFYDNAAGQILFGLVTRPAFELFGPSYLTLKCVTFALGWGVLVLTWAFARANFGRCAGTIAALLYALAPTTLFKYSLMHSGNHFENLFFSMAFLAALYRFQRTGSRAWLVASGFTAGFALFVFLGALIPIGIGAGLHLGVRGLRRSLRDAPLALFGLALGIAPLVALNAATGARGLGFLGAKFAEDTPAEATGVVARVSEFVTRHLFDATVYERCAGIEGAVFGALFLAAFLVAYLASVPHALRSLGALARGLLAPADDAAAMRERFERTKLVPFVLYLPLTALAYGVSNFRIGGHGPPIVVAGYRYFLPHLLFALILIAVVAAAWWQSGGAKRAFGASLAAVPLIAGLSNLALVDWSFAKPNLGAHYAGYNLAQVGRALIAGRNALTDEQIAAHLASFPPLLRRRVATSIGFNRGVLQIEKLRERAARPDADRSWRVDVREIVAPFSSLGSTSNGSTAAGGDVAPDLARGIGVAVRFSCQRPELLRVLAAAIEDDPRLGAYVAEGACLPPGTEPLESRTQALLGTNAAYLADAGGDDPSASPASATLRSALLRGAGLFCGRLRVRDIASERALLDEWSNAHAGELDFWIGVGQGLADGGESPRSPATLALVDDTPQARACWRAFGFALARSRGLRDATDAARRHAGERASTVEADLALGMRASDDAALAR